MGRGAAAHGLNPHSPLQPLYTITQGQSTNIPKVRDVPMGCAPVRTLVKCHHVPWGLRNCLVWKNDFQDRKRGLSYHTPQSPPAGDFCWKYFNFMGKHRSLGRAGDLLTFWGEDETLKEKVDSFSKQNLDETQISREAQPSLALPPVKFFSM